MAGKYQICVGLDAGSSRTRAVLFALLREKNLRYLDAMELSYSKLGWVRGRITDQDAVAESLRAAVSDAERGAGVSVEWVTLGCGGVDVKGAQSRGL